MENVKAVVMLRNSKDELFVLMSDKTHIQGFESISSAINCFGYTDNHARSHEASMSACVHFVMFQPKAIPVSSKSDMDEILGGPPYRSFYLTNVSGRYYGMLAQGEKARQIYDNGEEMNFALR